MADWPYNTSTWQKLRTAKLANKPLCEPCHARGDVTVAKAVDHVTPINAGGDPFPPLDGLMSMCERCHNEKTAMLDRKGAKPFARRFKGFDLNGNPIDPGDDWHREGASNHENGSGPVPSSQSGKYLVSGQTIDDADDFGVA